MTITWVTRKQLRERLGGVSRQRIHQLIREGKITETPRGIDLHRALGEFQENTDRGRVEAARAKRSTRQPECSTETGDEASIVAGGHRRPEGDAAQDDLFPNLSQSKARKEHWLAVKARFEAEQRAGIWVRRDEVMRVQYEVARVLRDQLLALPSRLSAWVPPDGRRELATEIERFIEGLQTALNQLEKTLATDRNRLTERGPVA